jgi:methionine-rich copper-binding protein CopC
MATLLLLSLPGTAWAHATLIDSSPRPGERLDALPSQVWFEFSQDMSAPAYVLVTAPDGTSVAQGEPRVDGLEVTQDLASGPEGTYTMAYQVVSEDGHPLAGEITFNVGASAAAEPNGSGPDPSETGRDGKTSVNAPPTTAASETVWSRRAVSASVAVALFGLSALLLLLARRTAPSAPAQGPPPHRTVDP